MINKSGKALSRSKGPAQPDNTAKRTGERVSSRPAKVVVRSLTRPNVKVTRTADGEYLVGGMKLIKKQTGQTIKRNISKPAHLSEERISEIVKSMKVA